MWKIKFFNGEEREFECLRGADLEGANLFRASLVGADLRQANLGGANLRGADLFKANLVRANLRGANLFRADLEDANLRGADLEGARLEGADLRGANLVDANLRGADLVGANLGGAKGIIVFQFQKHLGFSFKYQGTVYAKIGCKTFDLFKWCKEFDDIGSKEKYSEVEIEAYGDWLKWVKSKRHKLF